MPKTLKEIKQEFLTLTKRITKENLPSKETTEKNLHLCIEKFNEISRYLKDVETISESEAHEEEINNCFSYCRKLIKKVFIRVGEKVEVPRNLGTQINKEILTEEFSPDELTSESEGEMPNQSKFELGKFINGVVHQYDGSYADMNSFVNQVVIIQETTESENVNFALQVIKSKITNMLMTEKLDFTSFKTLTDSLKAGIQKPNTTAIENKILNFSQNTLRADQYKELVERNVSNLVEAYVAEGKPHANAEIDARKILLRSVEINARNPEVRQAMKFGQFSSTNQIYEKILELQEQAQQVLFVRKTNYRGRNNFTRGGNNKNGYKNERHNFRAASSNYRGRNYGYKGYRNRHRRNHNNIRNINHVVPKNQETPGTTGDFLSQQ